MILSATYMLWMFQRVNYGPVTNEKNASLPDLKPREWAVIVPIIALTIVMGVLPNLFLRPTEAVGAEHRRSGQRGCTLEIKQSRIQNPEFRMRTEFRVLNS